MALSKDVERKRKSRHEEEEENHKTVVKHRETKKSKKKKKRREKVRKKDDAVEEAESEGDGYKRSNHHRRKVLENEEQRIGSNHHRGFGDFMDNHVEKLESVVSDEEFFNALASDTSTRSSDNDDDDEEEGDRKKCKKGMKPQRKQGLLHWMRKPLDIDMFQECPLGLLPCLDPRLEDAVQKMGFQSLFPVQLALWQISIGPGGFERDICVNSPTGSGKTLAYALPLVQTLSTRKIRFLRAVVIVPTRDLAIQVKKVFDAVAPAVGLRVGLAIGQSSLEKEIRDLVCRPKFEMGMSFDPEDLQVNLHSNVDILVATPGRLVDHINTTKGFSLEHLQYLVVDEVDRLVSGAYQLWLPAVLQVSQVHKHGLFKQERTLLPTLNSMHNTRRCSVEGRFKDNMCSRLVKIILSATLTKDPSKLDQLDLHHPLYLTSGDRRYKLPEKLKSYKLICNTELRFLHLVALLEDLKGEKSIIFTPSITITHRLSTLLNLLGCLSCKISEYSRLQKQDVRSKTLKAFREGEIEVLVCSDAMTRGMDVEGIKNVINYEMPSYVKKYIHRAGRTARAGQDGNCFTFLRKHEVKSFKRMLQKVGIESCRVYNLPPESLQRLQPICTAAMEKLAQLESKSSKP